jgi:hypothetical protein
MGNRGVVLDGVPAVIGLDSSQHFGFANTCLPQYMVNLEKKTTVHTKASTSKDKRPSYHGSGSASSGGGLI